MEQIDPRKLLARVADVLNRLKIPYLVTGGMAVFVWGRPRYTADIDIIVELGPGNVDKLTSALRSLSEASYVGENSIQKALLQKGEFNFIDGESGIKVDFWVGGRNPFDKERFKRPVFKNVFGKRVAFISAEDLILSKLLWHRDGGSSRHLEDIESVLKIQKELDLRYIRKWAKIQSTARFLSCCAIELKQNR